MPEKNKKVELTEEDLEKVNGGYSYNVPPGYNGQEWICPNCGNSDHDKMRADSYIISSVECRVCWYIGPVGEFKIYPKRHC